MIVCRFSRADGSWSSLAAFPSHAIVMAAREPENDQSQMS